MASVAPGLARKVGELDSLYRLTDRLYRASTPNDVYDAALDAIIETLGCGRASILLFDNTGVMRFVAWRGLSDMYRRTLEGHSPWKPGERDPHPIFVEDIDRTSESDLVKSTIRNEGIRALAFIPLSARGEVIGKFMTYYPDPHLFGEHEIDLAVTIARQVAFSLERAQAERARILAEEELQRSEARFRLMAEHAPVMIWISDAKGKCVHLNAMLREFWGVDEDKVVDFDWQSTLHPADAPEVHRQVAAALVSRSRLTVSGRYRNAAGEYRVLRTIAQPSLSAQGELRGMIGVNADITDRMQAEQALRESEQRFRLAVEAAPSGMVMSRSDGRIVLLNAQAEKLFGYSREELVGQSIDVLVPERLRAAHPAHRSMFANAPSARAMGAGRDLFAVRRDGTEIPVEIGLSPIETADGPMTLAAVVDISERKRADAQRDLLLAELNHRVKNTLAVVQGLAHQTFRGIGTGSDALAAFDGRLDALAAAHNILTQTSWESASIERLAEDTLEARDGREDRVMIGGPDVLLSPRHALAIAMVFHELRTNAVKYGALSTESGGVSLTWEVVEERGRMLRLTWREHGGPPVIAPKKQGFGTRLIERAIAHDLGGEALLDFKPGGLICTIRAPLR